MKYLIIILIQCVVITVLFAVPVEDQNHQHPLNIFEYTSPDRVQNGQISTQKNRLKDDCNQPLRPGKCISYRSYYNKDEKECVGGFSYGICLLDTDRNNFDTIEACKELCLS